MEKLSCSHSSKKYLEEKYGVKSEPISDSLKSKLEEASESANKKIKHNNSIYNASNAHAHEMVVTEQTNDESQNLIEIALEVHNM